MTTTVDFDGTLHVVGGGGGGGGVTIHSGLSGRDATDSYPIGATRGQSIVAVTK